MNCGSVVGEGDKICPNCGRVIIHNKITRSHNSVMYNPQSKSGRRNSMNKNNLDYDTIYSSDVLRKKVEQPESQFTPEQRAALETDGHTRRGYSGRQNYGKIVPFVGKVIKIAILLVIIYLLVCFVRVTMVKTSDYKFDTKMELTCENYGEAMKAYFDDGSWHYRLSRNTVSYEGTKKKKVYKLTFKKENGQVIVDSLTIDDEQIPKKKIMKEYVMGMFMSEDGKSYEEKRKDQLDSIAKS